MARSKAYLFRGVEIRWSCDPALPRPRTFRPRRGCISRAASRDYLAASLDGREMLTPRPFAGEADFADGGSVEWAVAWPEDEEAGFIHSYCNTDPDARGRHPRGRPAQRADCAASRAMASWPATAAPRRSPART